VEATGATVISEEFGPTAQPARASNVTATHTNFIIFAPSCGFPRRAEVRYQTMQVSAPLAPGQKFFAPLFFKKAAAFFGLFRLG